MGADPFKGEVAESALGRVASPFRPGAGKVPPAFGGRTEPLRSAKTMVDRLATIARDFGVGDQRPLSEAGAVLIAAGHLYVPARGWVAFTVPGFGGWLTAHPEPA